MTRDCSAIPMPDVLLHAISDALLGAVALGDIGSICRHRCEVQGHR